MRTTIQVSEQTRKKLKVLASKQDLPYEELLTKMIEDFNQKTPGQAKVNVPKPLFKKISERVKDTGFKDADEYVTYVMRQVVTAAELHENKTKAFTKEDEREVRKRLEALGYI
jgi:hypothetical protein